MTTVLTPDSPGSSGTPRASSSAPAADTTTGAITPGDPATRPTGTGAPAGRTPSDPAGRMPSDSAGRTPSDPADREAQALHRSRLGARRRRRNLLWALLLAGPNLVLLLVFVYRPLLQSFYLSTLQWNLGSPVARPVGLGNYVEWFSAPTTGRIVTTTLVFTLATVGGAMVLGLGLALLLNRRLRGRGRPDGRVRAVRAVGLRGRDPVAVHVRPALRVGPGAARLGRRRVAPVVHAAPVAARDDRRGVPVEEPPGTSRSSTWRASSRCRRT